MRPALALLVVGGMGAAWWYWRGQGTTAAPAQPAAGGAAGGWGLGNIVDQLLWNIGNNSAPAPDEGPMNMDPNQPRGIRNNNPGNIRRSGDRWQGLSDTQTDSAFFQFTSPYYGIRALARTLKTYRDRYGLYTVRGIIDRWAPTVENNTNAYASHVAAYMGVSQDVPLSWDLGQLRALVSAIIRHENGQQPYDAALIDQAIKAAGW